VEWNLEKVRGKEIKEVGLISTLAQRFHVEHFFNGKKLSNVTHYLLLCPAMVNMVKGASGSSKKSLLKVHYEHRCCA